MAALSATTALVADHGNRVIRLVGTDGSVATFAGTGQAGTVDGDRAAALFDGPKDVAVDGAGNVYFTDDVEHRVRRINLAGAVQTLAGDGTAGFADGAGASAEFYGLESLDVSPDGHTVYVSDGNGGDGSAHNRVRVIAIP